jgi:hypothetical protein
VRAAQIRVALHGSIVLSIGLLCGVPYGQAITASWGADAVRAWHTAHLGLVVGGVWMLASAGVLSFLELGPRLRTALVLLLVVSGYGFSLALVVAASSGVRGLEPVGPIVNWVAFVGNTIAAAAALGSLGIIMVGCARGIAVASGDDGRSR